MLVVDSSVWIDYFNQTGAPSSPLLKHLLRNGEVRIVVPNLIFFEVLRGFRSERTYRAAKQFLESLDIEAIAGHDLALVAAGHYRSLRAQGVTVRGPIDVLVATCCIEQDYALLHRDRDFDPFEALRGLRGWQHCTHTGRRGATRTARRFNDKQLQHVHTRPRRHPPVASGRPRLAQSAGGPQRLQRPDHRRADRLFR